MRRFAFLFTALIAMGSAHAQTTSLRDGPSIAEASESAPVLLKSVEFRGASAIEASDLRAEMESHLDAYITRGALQDIANAITKTYVDRGFFLSKAAIRPQPLKGGVLVVDIVEGTLTGVVVNGDEHHPLTSYFDKARAERPVRRDTFERALTLISGLPGTEITGRTLDDDERGDGAHILRLSVKKSRVRAQLDATNKGTREGAAWRALANVDVSSVVTEGDELTIGGLTRPAAASELTYLVGRYSTPIGRTGLVGFSEGVYSDTSPRSALIGRDLDGSLRSFALGLDYPLIQSRRSQLRVGGRFDWTNSQEFEDDALLYFDRLRVIRANTQYSTQLGENGRGVVSMQASSGLSALNATNNIGVATSRPDADGQTFKLDGRVAAQKFVTDRISFTGSAIGQYADNPLLFLEEFALGGGSYGRGYDFGEVIGDQGVAGFVEAGYHGGALGPIGRWQLYSFADAGAVWNAGEGFSVDGDPLYSAGGGIRINLLDAISLNYEAAYPIADAPFTEDDENVRHRLQIGVRYEFD